MVHKDAKTVEEYLAALSEDRREALTFSKTSVSELITQYESIKGKR